MTCQEVADFLLDYLDGELPPTERAIFEEHLGICPECVAYMQTYKMTIKASQAAREPVHHSDANNIPDDLVRAILAARNKQGSR